MENNAMKWASAQVEEGMKEYIRKDYIFKLLDNMARFEKFSFKNVVLITKQTPEAKIVMSKKKWEEAGRTVKEDHKKARIAIFCPKESKTFEYVEVRDKNGKCVYDPETGKKQFEKKYISTIRLGTTIGYVYDQKDTEPIKNVKSKTNEDIFVRQSIKEMDKDSLMNYLVCASKIKIMKDKDVKHNAIFDKESNTLLFPNKPMSSEEKINLLCECFIQKNIIDSFHLRIKNKAYSLNKEDQKIVKDLAAYILNTRLGIKCTSNNFSKIGTWRSSKNEKIVEAVFTSIQKEINTVYGNMISLVKESMNKNLDHPKMVYKTSLGKMEVAKKIKSNESFKEKNKNVHTDHEDD